MLRHALGVTGVLAAGVLLAVSAAMNYRFGVNLGRTELDGQIYGVASAAADCLKALVPFFLFAALRTRMWSQAAASVLVLCVVTAYSLTSALGHAALNRFDKTAQRTQQAQSYKDLRADLKRAEGQLSWIPQHRPAETVQSAIDGLKTKRAWKWSKGCTVTRNRTTRGFCQQLHTLSSELASARQAAALEARIAGVKAELAQVKGEGHQAGGDPQATVLAKVAGLVVPGITVEDVQMAMTIFIALLLEVGSGLGIYIAFSQWRINDRLVPVAPARTIVAAAPAVEPAKVEQVAIEAAEVEQIPAITSEQPETEPMVASANDNKSVSQATSAPRLVAPESDVQGFYRERIETREGSSLTATALYEDYCEWCEEHNKEPLALPTFGREFGELGVHKAKIAGRVRYLGIGLKAEEDHEEDKKPPVYDVKAA